MTTTFTGKNLETALQKASTTLGVEVGQIRYDFLAGKTGGHVLIRVTGTGAPAPVATGMVEQLSGSNPTAVEPAEARGERSERPERRDRPERGERRDRPERGERRDRPEREPRAERPEREPRAERPEREPRAERPEREPRAERPEREPRAERPERNDRRERRNDRREDRGERFERGDRRRREDRDELLPVPADGPTEVSSRIADGHTLSPFGEKVQELLVGTLQRMGFGVALELSEGAEEVRANFVSAPYHEAFVAKDLELLDAVEHLVEKSALNQTELPEGAVRKKLVLDINGFREKADSDLAHSARLMAQRAIEESRVFKLGPLDPRARRVVHLTLREMHGVETASEGEGVFRRVCIIPKGLAAS